MGIGCDRSRKGTGFTTQYAPAVAAVLDNPETCYPELLLFFHNLPWDWRHSSWAKNETLLDRIRETHRVALENATAMARAWDSLEESLRDKHLFAAVQRRFAQQLNDAAVFSQVLLQYYDSLARGPVV